MKSAYRSAMVGPLLALAGACGGDSPSIEVAVVRDSAGVEVITHSPTFELSTRLLTLDSNWPAGTDMSFGDLVDIETLPDGRVALLDAMNAQVTVLSPAGTVEASFGGRGEGPGEFSPVIAHVVATDSTVLVPDFALQRITEFSMDGRVIEARSTMGGETLGFGVYVDWRRHPHGGLATRVWSESGDLIVRVSESGVDTLYTSSVPRGRVLLEPILIWDLDTEGRVIAARSDRPEIRRENPRTMEVDRIVRGLGSDREFTDEDREHLLELVMGAVAEMAGAQLSQADRDGVLAGFESPTHAPVLSAVYVSPEGRYWVQQARSVQSVGREIAQFSAENMGGREWWVLSETGTLEEVVTLPEGFLPRRFAGPWIYGILSDAVGVQTVGRILR